MPFIHLGFRAFLLFLILFSHASYSQMDRQMLEESLVKAEVLDFNNKLISEFEALDIDLIAPNLIAIKDYLGYQISDINAKILIRKHFDHVELINNKYILAHQKNKFGLYLLDGTEILSPQFDSIFVTKNFILASKRTPGLGNWEVFNLDGQKITLLHYEEIGTEGENVLSVKRRGYWGFLNLNGQEIISCKYNGADAFYKGLSRVQYLGGVGIIDKSGEWVVEPFYKSVDLLEDGSYIYRNALFNTLVYPGIGKVLESDAEIQPFGSFVKAIQRDGKFAFYNTFGVRIGYSTFEEITSLITDTLFAVRNNGDWYFLNRNGGIKKIPTERISVIKDLHEGYITVMIDGKYGFIDRDGLLRVANRYNEVKMFSEGLAPVQILNKWGYIDQRESIMIQPNFDMVGTFIEGSALAIRQGKYGIIDNSGKSIQGFIFEELQRLPDGKYLSISGGKKGLLDATGKQLIYPKYDQITDLGNGYAIVKKGENMGVMSYKNMSIVPLIYSKIIYDASNDLLVGLRSNKAY